MNCDDVKPNLKVRVTRLGSVKGMVLAQAYMAARRLGVEGVVVMAIPGHGGEVLLVRHTDTDEAAAYCLDELEPAEVSHEFAFRYRCRKCQATTTHGVFKGSVGDAVQQLVDAMNVQNQSPGDARLFVLHSCSRGNMGVADLIGYELQEVKG